MINIFETVRRWRRRNATITDINKLDNRMLADIGIVRGDIRNVARRLG